MVAWTVVGLEVTVVVRDLQAARTTLPEFLDTIRRDYGPVQSPRAPAGAGEGELLANNGTGDGGLRHRAPSQGAAVEMVAGSASSTMS